MLRLLVSVGSQMLNTSVLKTQTKPLGQGSVGTDFDLCLI